MIAELRSVKEELFKDKATGIKPLIGPPLTILLIAEGLLTVQQEIGAGILISSMLESSPVSKKRKHAPEMEPIGTEK